MELQDKIRVRAKLGVVCNLQQCHQEACCGVLALDLASSWTDSCLPAFSCFALLLGTRWQEARASLQRLLSAQEGVIRDDQRLRQQAIIPMAVLQQLKRKSHMQVGSPAREEQQANLPYRAEGSASKQDMGFTACATSAVLSHRKQPSSIA
eukprot:3162-Pelagomonas_calceolata.AAC.2